MKCHEICNLLLDHLTKERERKKESGCVCVGERSNICGKITVGEFK